MEMSPARLPLPPDAERRYVPTALRLWLAQAQRGGLGAALLGWTLWCIAALYDLPQALPGWLRVALLALLAAASMVAMLRGLMRAPLPARARVLRRIEEETGLVPGALELFDSQPVSDGDSGALALWAKARSALPRREGRSAAQPPSLEFRYGLLPLLLTALLIGLLLAKDTAPQRLASALSPWPDDLSAFQLTVRVTPPVYALASGSTRTIGPGESAPLAVLAGSTLDLRVNGIDHGWRVIAADGRDYRPAAGRVRLGVDRGGTLRLVRGPRRLAQLPLTLLSDAPPGIRWLSAPAVTANNAVRLAFRSTDDHGRLSLGIELQRGSARRSLPVGDSLLPGEQLEFVDLTPDRWAGETVALRLVAGDGAGQAAATLWERVRLPQRQFRHPVARAVIAVRTALIDQGPSQPLIDALTAIAADTGAFGDDARVFAGLRAAAWRLAYDRVDTRGDGTVPLLWDVALDLEDGGESRAMTDVRRAFDRLSDALRTGEDPARLSALSQALADAVAAYLQKAAAAGAAAPPDVGGGAQAIDGSMFEALLRDISDRLAAGDAKGAEAALANLRQLMEALRFGPPAFDPAAAAAARAAAAEAQALRDLAAEQRALQGETLAASVRSALGNDANDASVMQRQAGLGTRAAGVKGAGEALRPMRRAVQALEQGATSAALSAQGQAADALEAAARAAEARARSMLMAAGGAQPAGMPGSGVDPLGRPGAGFGSGEVNVPHEADLRRVQAIRQLLEERAADPARSERERNYYLRLLERF